LEKIQTIFVKLDASKYLREVMAKFDMVGAHPSPIPAPAGMKIYANESWDGDEKFRNLYQQYCGCINYAALIRPELSYNASQICRVMSMPNEQNLRVVQNILKYAIGSLDEKITYRPTDADDPFGGYNYGLMTFTDSDWATSVDTRTSHGCYIVMLAGGCIAHRSKAHKSVMLSSAAAEYYETSEGCRELIYIRGILEDFMESHFLPPQCILRMRLASLWENACFQFACAISRNVATRESSSSDTLGPSINWQILGPKHCLHLPLFLCVMSSLAKCLLVLSKECRIQCCRVELLFALIPQLRMFMYVIELIGY
jgi:hypothetical protein